ncbi:alcohol dehydrogenase catalytic domain-containing protein [Caballeronia novacaledonica]|uniref:alcohol dehydrogenase catalytic domain-containing protein n=1 Tax=Caballeronia novacaledonica TaxID=1544861 RepID=UPI001EE1EB0B|nr:alcohol dehydrogenase catalytic domain-containing protein [Caballeronia novacaledonica]
MKAIRFHEFGGPEVLRYEDAPKPELKPGEVLGRVHAVGVNPPDWYLREGNRMHPPEWRPPIALPAIQGSHMSGVVEAVAADASGFFVGNEVFGMIRFPSFTRADVGPPLLDGTEPYLTVRLGRTGFESRVESSRPAGPPAGDSSGRSAEAAGRSTHGSFRFSSPVGDIALSPTMPSASADYARLAPTLADMSPVSGAGRVEPSGDSTGDGPRLGLHAFGGCRRVRQSRAADETPPVSPPPWTRSTAIS